MCAAIAAEHRDRLGEAVQGLALDPDQAVKPPRQFEALGDVVEQIGDAAFRVRRGDDAHRAAVGQIPGVLFRLDRAIGLVQLRLPDAKIRLLGQLARGAQPVKHARIVGIVVEEGAIEIPQPAIGIVIEGKPPPVVENGDAGRQLVEGAAMRLRHPHQCRTECGGFAGVDRDAGAAAADPAGAHIVEAPLAADHDRQPLGEAGPGLQGTVHLAAVAAVEQFEIAGDGVGDAGGLGCACIGGVDIAETAIGAPGPDRPRCRGGEAAQHLGLFEQRLVPEIGLGQLLAQSAEFADPHNGLSADGAAHRLEGASVQGGEVEQKALAGLAQRVDRVIHLPRRLRRQPGSGRQDALRLVLRGVRRQQRRYVAADLRPVIARGPGYQDLGFGEQQRPVAVGLDLQGLDVGTQPRLVFRRAQSGPHQQDRRHHGEAEQRQRRGQHREFLAVEPEQALQRSRILGIGWRDRQQRGGAKGDQAVARQ